MLVLKLADWANFFAGQLSECLPMLMGYDGTNAIFGNHCGVIMVYCR